MTGMKLSRVFALTAIMISSLTLAQTSDVGLYEFAPKAAVTVETQTTTTISETSVASETSATTQDVLIADAQLLIKDKLVQKYQVVLDDVVTRLTGKLNMVSAEAQRTALTELRARLSEKKTTVVAQKNIDPLKKEIIIALLDHLLSRIDGLIAQSAQTKVQTSQV